MNKDLHDFNFDKCNKILDLDKMVGIFGMSLGTIRGFAIKNHLLCWADTKLRNGYKRGINLSLLLQALIESDFEYHNLKAARAMVEIRERKYDLDSLPSVERPKRPSRAKVKNALEPDKF